MWNTLETRRNTWIGHLIRSSPWTTTVIERKLEGKPGRGTGPEHR